MLRDNISSNPQQFLLKSPPPSPKVVMCKHTMPIQNELEKHSITHNPTFGVLRSSTSIYCCVHIIM